MKPVTMTNNQTVDQTDSLGRFGSFHALEADIDIGIGVGYPIIHVGKSEAIDIF